MHSSEAEFDFCCQDPASLYALLGLKCWHEYSNVLRKYMFLGETEAKAMFGVTGKVFSHTLDKIYHFSFKSKSHNVSNFFNAFTILQEIFILSVLVS